MLRSIPQKRGARFQMNHFVRFAAAVTFSFCASAAWATTGSVKLKVQYFDFLYHGTPSGTYGGYAGMGHPDFEFFNCGAEQGLVKSTLINTRPVFNSVGSPQCIASKKSFYSWFRSAPGINVPLKGTLTMQNIGDNTYQYNNPYFFPLDGKGFNTDGFQSDQGLDGKEHNFSFSMHAHWTTAITDNSQYISVAGDDDIWIFVDNKLVIDLGGVHGSESGSYTFSAINLIGLGISLGQTLPFDVFVVERHTNGSDLKLTTNVPLP